MRLARVFRSKIAVRLAILPYRSAVGAALVCAGVVSGGCAPRPGVASGAAAPRATSADVLLPATRVDYLDTLAREPMVAEHPSGALFVTGYNHRRPALWRSVDRGATWTPVDVGDAAQGAVGNSDVDLAVGPDGTLYFVTLSFDSASGHGTRVAVGVTHDTATTWHWTTLSQAVGDDRPWVAVTPDGTAHVVWNDGHGVQHALSRDRGTTWTRLTRVYERGGSSHLAAGPHGELAVRIAPGASGGNVCDEGADLVMISVDGGATWRPRPAPGGARAPGCGDSPHREIPRWVDPLAWDDAGALYALWTTKAGVWLGRSGDQGETWTTWRIAAGTTDTAFYPYLTARGTGSLAATWFTMRGDSLRWRAARLAFAGAAPPRVAISPPMSVESARGDPLVPDTGGEYLAAMLLSDGSIAVVTPIQHETAHRLGFAWWRFAGR